MKRILIAEYDENTADPLADVLEKEGHLVTQAYLSTDKAWSAAEANDFDVVVIGDHFAMFNKQGLDATIEAAVDKFNCPVWVFGDKRYSELIEVLGARWLEFESFEGVSAQIAA